MSYRTTQIEGAIARSISHDEVVTVVVSDIIDAYEDLTSDALAYNWHGTDTRDQYGKPMREVRGQSEDGDDWRVHLLAR